MLNKISTSLAVLLLAAPIFMLSPGKVYACSCMPPGSVDQEIANYDVVFRGIVQDTQEPGPESSGAGTITSTFTVQEVWKGDIKTPAAVNTADNSAACGFNFELGEEYLVFASQDPQGNLSTYLCSPTKLVSAADADLSLLGDGQTNIETRGEALEPSPSDTPQLISPPAPDNQISLAIAIATLILVIVVLANQVTIMRRMRK